MQKRLATESPGGGRRKPRHSRKEVIADPNAMSLAGLRLRLRALKREALTVYFAARDPRLPWPVRLLALGIAAYALSPIDLIPDFIPVLGYLDDLILVPLGVALVVRLTPPPILADARAQAERVAVRPVSVIAAVIIALIWLLLLAAAGLWWWRRQG